MTDVSADRRSAGSAGPSNKCAYSRGSHAIQVTHAGFALVSGNSLCQRPQGLSGREVAANGFRAMRDERERQERKTQELLCQEYVIQTDQVLYRIRPKDDKHPLLLPIGQNAQFRLEKNKMLLACGRRGQGARVRCSVHQTACRQRRRRCEPARVNHLQ